MTLTTTNPQGVTTGTPDIIRTAVNAAERHTVRFVSTGTIDGALTFWLNGTTDPYLQAHAAMAVPAGYTKVLKIHLGDGDVLWAQGDTVVFSWTDEYEIP